MLRARTSNGIYFAGLKTERFQAAAAKVSAPASGHRTGFPRAMVGAYAPRRSATVKQPNEPRLLEVS